MKFDIKIRQALSKDVRKVSEIKINTWKVAYKELLPKSVFKTLDLNKEIEKRRRYIMDNNGWKGMYVAEVEGEVVGFSFTGPAKQNPVVDNIEKCAEILALYVLPEFQKFGIGSALVEYDKKTFKKNGYKHFVLWCLKGNDSARKFYEKQGGVLIGEKEMELRGTNQIEVCYKFDI